jgi:hypothetical protein
VDKLLAYLHKGKATQATPSFTFGEYGRNALNYTSQPSLSGLLENEDFVLASMNELKAIYRKSTVVRDSFLSTCTRWTGSKVNVSSYPDNVWARWCAASAILIIEHIHKMSTQPKTYRQVLLQDNGGMKDRIDALINLYSGGAPLAVKAEQDTVVATAPASSSSSSTSLWQPQRIRTDFSGFVGGAMLKACLSGDGADDVVEDEQHEDDLLLEAYAAAVPSEVRKKPAAAGKVEPAPKKQKKGAVQPEKELEKKGALELDLVTEKPGSIMTEFGRLSIITTKHLDAYVSCAQGRLQLQVYPFMVSTQITTTSKS